MPRHSYAELDSVRLHYAAEGAEDGDLILFAHGFPEFWYAWKKQLAEFGRSRLAVAPDMRGYNLSSKPANVEDYELKNLVEDLRGLAAHFGCGGDKKFTLVAHDWGGVVACAFALVYPERLDRLVLINAPHLAVFRRELAQNPAQRKASEYIQFFRTPAAESMLSANNFAALSAIVLTPGLERGYFNDADRRAYLEAWSQPGALTGGLNYYRALPRVTDKDANDDLPTLLPGAKSWIVQVPTMFLWGMKDTALLPGNLDGLEESVPNNRIERMPEGTHWVVHEQPDLINRHIHDFLGGKTIWRTEAAAARK
jgi:pimeloyl-ACP methyl ester carboxylesterase